MPMPALSASLGYEKYALFGRRRGALTGPGTLIERLVGGEGKLRYQTGFCRSQII